MSYLAHIAQDGRQQTVSEHLNGTAELIRGGLLGWPTTWESIPPHSSAG